MIRITVCLAGETLHDILQGDENPNDTPDTNKSRHGGGVNQNGIQSFNGRRSRSGGGTLHWSGTLCGSWSRAGFGRRSCGGSHRSGSGLGGGRHRWRSAKSRTWSPGRTTWRQRRQFDGRRGSRFRGQIDANRFLFGLHFAGGFLQGLGARGCSRQWIIRR